MRRDFDVIVLGGGAAGLMCAIEAGKRGRRVAVLEHAERIGKKILISGGGRCNFTNLHCRPENFISANPHFCKSALARYTPADFIALVRKHGIAYHEKKLGQLFCDGSAREIVAMLEQECAAAGVQIFTGTKISEVRRADVFEVATERRRSVAPALVVATGGLSIPKIGATSFGYDLARQFGLKIRAMPAGAGSAALRRRRPASITATSREFPPKSSRSRDGQRFREKMLFTHRGLSGPAILQISSYWRPGEAITLDLAPGSGSAGARFAVQRRTAMRRCCGRRCGRSLPIRFADRWLELHAPAGLAERRARRTRAQRFMHGRSLRPAPKATRRPRSRRAALIPTSSQPRRWSRARFRGCTSSERWSTSPDISAASISSGPGRRDSRPARRSDPSRTTTLVVHC